MGADYAYTADENEPVFDEYHEEWMCLDFIDPKIYTEEFRKIRI